MKRNSSRRAYSNSKGFSLTEIMIAVALMGIVGLGLASMMAEMAKQQRAANIRSLLTSQKQQFETIIKTSSSWNKTVNGAINNFGEFLCLKVPPPPPYDVNQCASGNPPRTAFAFYDTAGNLFYDATNPINGFDIRGAACPPGPGWPSNTCPIKWDVNIQETCQNGAATCFNPDIHVWGQPNIDPTIAANLGIAINPANYKFDIVRGQGTRFDPVLVTEFLVTTNLVGAGNCAVGPAGVWRKLNTKVQDPNGNVVSTGPDQVTLVPGSYQCRVTAPAFKVGSHYIEFVNRSTNSVIGTSAPAISPFAYTIVSTAILEVTFTISANTSFGVRHVCNDLPVPVGTKGNVNPTDQLGWGTASSYGGSTTFTSVSCYRNG